MREQEREREREKQTEKRERRKKESEKEKYIEKTETQKSQTEREKRAVAQQAGDRGPPLGQAFHTKLAGCLLKDLDHILPPAPSLDL